MGDAIWQNCDNGTVWHALSSSPANAHSNVVRLIGFVLGGVLEMVTPPSVAGRCNEIYPERLGEVAMADNRLCSVPDCNKPHKGHGYCRKHLDRVRKHGCPDLQNQPIDKCTIKGCDNPHAARGLCSRHYSNLRRHGHPEKSSTPKGAPAHYLTRLFDGDQLPACVFWPYARNDQGYGQLTWLGRKTYAHRIACEHVNGPAPTPKHEAAHSCGNGHLGCVNPHHLEWKTSYENHQDRHTHGTVAHGDSHHGAKLKADDIPKIRALKGALSANRIGQQYGVHHMTIRDIFSGVTWKHVP